MAIPPEESTAWIQWQDWQADKRAVDEWTQGDFAVDRVSWLIATVSNGGWIDVLANSCDGYLDAILSALNDIGANETLGFLKQCIDRFPKGRLYNDVYERGKQIQSLSPQDRDFIDSLDDEFYASNEDICAMAMKYWREIR